MPQMAPLNWTSMYCYFICLMFLSIIMNYFIFLYKPKFKNQSLKKTFLNWKW
uniref:ATP synthase F0 subunit 8 n=1 Tax=Kyklioacalles sp. BMNH 1043787 TaxID=2834675 RepID=A0A8F4WG22_9CUCU|nr:ATP synthase F0 subunit 8 [Kyklioacalles sp. BMNH 1043787]